MGQVLKPFREIDSDTDQGNGVSACFASMQGWRQTQEDDHTVCCEVPGHKHLGFFAVYDGHGGPSVAKLASEEVIKAFSETLPSGNKQLPPEELAEFLKQAVMKADINIAHFNNGQGRQRFMHEGCTAIICVVTASHIICANVGDSRAILVTLSGAPGVRTVVALSEDHKPGNEKERKRIENAEMRVFDCNGVHRVNGDLAVARALGDFSFKNPDTAQALQAVSCEPEIRIAKRSADHPQILCLACDGIWDVSDNNETGEYIHKELLQHKGILTAAAQLILFCLEERGSRDNMSVLLCDLNSNFEFGEVPEIESDEDDEDESEHGRASEASAAGRSEGGATR